MFNVFNDVSDLRDALGHDVKLVVTSGGFDPIHVGHIRCITATAEISRVMTDMTGEVHKTVVIVNGDSFLRSKKGQPFMRLRERAEIVSNIVGVDAVMTWDVPTIFAKGGDRSARSVVPESWVCDELGCKIIFGVGGAGKDQSSSDLTSGKWLDLLDEQRIVNKPWGYELLIVKTDKYAAKILGIHAGKRLSLQYHNVKDETIHVVSGLLEAQIGDVTVFLGPGETVRVKPGVKHRFCASKGFVKLFEVSTPELTDVVRLSDDFGRQ
jgi:mannose-6-phosphate isomerase-like protein (cupin superfamily)